MTEKKVNLVDKITPLPSLALNRPITVLMTLLAMLVVGFLAYSQISIDLLPAGNTRPFLGVWVPYPNANPEEVEQFIARPIEEVVRTIKGVETVSTRSFTNGTWAFIRFNQGTAMDVAYSQLRDRMERVKIDLPDDVERIFIRKWSDDDSPVMWLALIPSEPVEDPYYLTEQLVKRPLERIDGVANVEIWGADEKSIQILVNQDAVKSYKINLYDVIENLRRDNFAISSGHIRSGGQKIYVRSVGKFKALEHIRNLPIRGTNILLKDIAEVRYDVPDQTQRWIQRIDGKKAIQIGVFKESIANTVDICRMVDEKIHNEIMKDSRMANFKTEILFNQGKYIVESVDNLKKAGMWGGFFAFLVLYFFLRRFRMTLLLNIAIPLSIVASLTTMYFIGWSLNIVTMMGLMISIGMVVDNSIVVLENIYNKRAQGYDIREAAGYGASEVSLAVTMATFTTIVVFLPLILMNDNVNFQFYMMRIGLPVIFSLLASLFVAMVFIPLMATKVISKRQVKEPKAIYYLNGKYQNTLRWVLQHRLQTMLILVAILVSTGMIMNKIGRTDNMEGNINDFRLMIDLPDNYTLEEAGKAVKAMEDTIRAKEDIYKIKTIDVRYRKDFARINVFLQEEEPESWYEVLYKGLVGLFGIKSEKRMSRDEVLADVKKRLPKFSGVKIRTSWRQSASESDASLTINLLGDDTNRLAELSKEVERRLRRIPEIISIETDRETGVDEIRLVIKREQVQKYGINPRVISGTVMYALRGIQLPKYQTDEKEINMTIQLRPEDRKNLQQLKNITFFTRNGKEVPLAALANFTVKKGFGAIHRENGKTFLAIKVNTTVDNMQAIYKKVDQVMAGFKMPYGYSWNKGQRFMRMQQSGQSQMFAIILAITFVFLLMGILFESFVLPLSVIMSIPFAFVGAYWILFITDTTMDMMSQIGFVILIGIVVNNAIVLIDMVNRLRKVGYSRFEALIEAGKNRFRPILMTAFTTIGGLIPMAVGNTKMIGIPYSPMGRTIIGGLVFSTFVSLIAVPWAYTLFDDMRNYFRRLVSGVLVKKTAPAPEADTV
ncbi:MAG TPA: efflux RND transporter permease subunit [Caldithrix abyssi]|uniref:Efflux RND transporter permease subunit n=1 Tax=Caldithrix abyssi TaxID=187145 RepID=A0A7V4TY55_CALAY|nr:efflux RND transporter permease subunit [Caldithrix abyssi]